jgi:hypothetical protein
VEQVLGHGGSALRLQLQCRRQRDSQAALQAAAALAEAVLRCPALTQGRHVLELCTCDAPLAAFAALRWCSRAVSAAADDAQLQLVRGNAQRNGHLVIIERLRLWQLDWRIPSQQQGQPGQQADKYRWQRRKEQEAQLLQAFPGGFDAVVVAVGFECGDGSEVCQLVAAAAAFLAHDPGSALLLAMPSGPGMQQAALDAAAAASLQPAPHLISLGTAAVPPAVQLLCLAHQLLNERSPSQMSL